MQRITATIIAADAANRKRTDVAPAALIDGLHHGDVLRLLLAEGRAVGGHADAFWCSCPWR